MSAQEIKDSAELREAILKAGTVRFASGVFTQKHYSNGTASPIEHKVQKILEIGINNLMELIEAYTAAQVATVCQQEEIKTLRARIRHLQMYIRWKRMFMGYEPDETKGTRKKIAQLKSRLAHLTTKQEEGEK